MKRNLWGWGTCALFLLAFALAAGRTAAGPRPVRNTGGPVPAGVLSVNGCSGCHVSSPEPRRTSPEPGSLAYLNSRTIINR
ncbi:MAG TPA: hypothetical protein VLT87_27965 [Thermoanaerobaculia bacterium]|nr:hypothetical protein [Thermoanaerobaculia bacterium]